MGTQLTPTEGSSFKKALSLKIEMDQQESLKNDAIVSDIQKSLTNVLTYIPLTPTDPSPEEMKNLLQEIDDIENALSTNDGIMFAQLLKKYPKEHFAEYIESRMSYVFDGTGKMFLNLCKINYYLQQNGKDLRTDNPSLKHRLLRSMLQDSIVYSKNTKVSFGELYPFLTEKDLLDIVDMAYGAEEDIGRILEENITYELARVLIEHKEKYNRVLSPQVYLKIFDYFEEEYRFLVKDSEYKYFPEEAKHLAFTIKMGSSFGIDMLFPNKYTILSKEKNNFREDIKNKYF